MTTTNQIPLNDILKKISESQKKYSFPIFIPSLNKEVPFHQMTTSQQKNFLKASMSDSDRHSNTMYALFAVINDNLADKTIDPCKFTVLDKLIISIAMRAYSVSPEYKVQLNDIKHEDGTPATAKINLGALISKIIKAFKGKKFTKTISSESSDIQAVISLPTIGTEIGIEKEYEESARREAQTGETEESRTNGLGELYILECVKFLTTIIIKDENGEQIEIDVSSMPPSEKKQTFESLPSSLSVKIAEEVNQTLSELGDITLLEVKDSNGEAHKYKIDVVDPDFFIGS